MPIRSRPFARTRSSADCARETRLGDRRASVTIDNTHAETTAQQHRDVLERRHMRGRQAPALARPPWKLSMNARVSGCCGMIEDLARRAGLDGASALEVDHLIRHRVREVQIVRDDDQRLAEIVERAQQRRDLAHEPRIERRRRLVEQDDRRLHRQRPRDRHALLLAARQPRRIFVFLAGQADPRSGRVRAISSACGRFIFLTVIGASITFSSAVRCGNRLKFWKTRPTFILTRLTRSSSSAADSFAPAVPRTSTSLNLDLPFVEPFEPVQAAQHRGFAAAGRSENGRELGLGDAERGAIQHARRAVSLDDVGHLDHGMDSPRCAAAL